jgi:hypothetical protein
MSRLQGVRHALVFVAAIFLIWLAGVMPLLASKNAAGVSPMQALGELGAPTVAGLVAAWPIYIAVGICQALTFHFVKAWRTPVFLVGVFVLASLFAWRYWNVAG